MQTGTVPLLRLRMNFRVLLTTVFLFLVVCSRHGVAASRVENVLDANSLARTDEGGPTLLSDGIEVVELR